MTIKAGTIIIGSGFDYSHDAFCPGAWGKRKNDYSILSSR